MNYINVICKHCKNQFEVSVRWHNQHNKRGYNNFFCSKQCKNSFQTKRKKLSCPQCKQLFQPTSYRKKFCSQSCAATYNNTHKTFGTRISKLELYLQEELSNLYKFEFKFNSKEEINSELDIYIPSLKLAFELNGIFHYEPIFGQAKLAQIQNNDERKFQACFENDVELCIIDSSSLKYFNEQNAKKYLLIITKIINKKFSATET